MKARPAPPLRVTAPWPQPHMPNPEPDVPVAPPQGPDQGPPDPHRPVGEEPGSFSLAPETSRCTRAPKSYRCLASTWPG